MNRILPGIVAGALLLCACSSETDIATHVDESEVPAIDFNYIVVSNGRIQTTHGINYEFVSAAGLEATQPKNRLDNFDGTPYKISLAAFTSADSALMIHAETVADMSGASDYSNLPEGDWPDASFRSEGHACMEVPAEAIEGEHDLLWLQSNGFDPVGTILFAQHFANTSDMNTEVVLSILLHVPGCDDEVANLEAIRNFKAAISVTGV